MTAKRTTPRPYDFQVVSLFSDGTVARKTFAYRDDAQARAEAVDHYQGELARPTCMAALVLQKVTPVPSPTGFWTIAMHGLGRGVGAEA